MTISLKHAFTSAKVDGGDTTVVRPSNWNAEHTLTLATNKIIGRATAGTGTAEEIDCTSIGRDIISKATVAAVLDYLGVSPFTTGDVKMTLKTSADTGWVMFDDGTIGSATSGASSRANADCEDLFTLLYNNISDANAPILTSAGVATTRAAQTNAATAWSNNCRMSLTKTLGRALAVAGAGSGLTSRALGVVAGAETVALAEAELPSHRHNVYIYDPGHGHSGSFAAGGGLNNNNGGGGGSFGAFTAYSSVSNNTTGITIGSVSGASANDNRTAATGSGTAHANVQPTSFLNAMVKL